MAELTHFRFDQSFPKLPIHIVILFRIRFRS